MTDNTISPLPVLDVLELANENAALKDQNARLRRLLMSAKETIEDELTVAHQMYEVSPAPSYRKEIDYLTSQLADIEQALTQEEEG